MLGVITAFLSIGNEVSERYGATFIYNGSLPRVRDANHVRDIRSANRAELEALLATVYQVYAGVPHRRFDIDPFTPPHVETYLNLSGYQQSSALVMALDGEPGGRPADVPISPVQTEEDRSALRDLLVMFNAPYYGETLAQLVTVHLTTRSSITWWLAKRDDQPAGFLSGWIHSDLCFLEDLFVHPDFRNRGIATALIHRVTRELRSQGGGMAFLQADPNDTPKNMYRRMGFQPVAVLREYWRDIEA
jgi:ribosomal protein S18 acetylase RimI-like enzyme